MTRQFAGAVAVAGTRVAVICATSFGLELAHRIARLAGFQIRPRIVYERLLCIGESLGSGRGNGRSDKDGRANYGADDHKCEPHYISECYRIMCHSVLPI